LFKKHFEKMSYVWGCGTIAKQPQNVTGGMTLF
jgi:hypothetical protein